MIIIVGAGLAGLSAAYKLLKAGCNDFLIIEAKHRVGGRIESSYAEDGSRLNMGAHWLHGEAENPVYEWLKDIDCIEGPDDEEVEFEGLFRTALGKEPPSILVNKVLELLLDAKKTLYKTASQLDVNVRPVDIFRRCIMMERPQLLKLADAHVIDAILEWFELYEAIDNSCENISLLSLKAYSDWTDYDEGNLVLLKDGWTTVVTKLAKYIGEEKK